VQVLPLSICVKCRGLDGRAVANEPIQDVNGFPDPTCDEMAKLYRMILHCQVLPESSTVTRTPVLQCRDRRPVRADPVYHPASRPGQACPHFHSYPPSTALTRGGTAHLARTGRGRGRGAGGRRRTGQALWATMYGWQQGRMGTVWGNSSEQGHLPSPQTRWGPAVLHKSLSTFFQQDSPLIIQVTKQLGCLGLTQVMRICRRLDHEQFVMPAKRE
jgi:hypothetical protein